MLKNCTAIPINDDGARPTGALTLDSLTPSSALPAANIVITGSGFGADQGGSAVQVGNRVLKASRILGWSDTRLDVRLDNYHCSSFSAADSKTENVTVEVGGEVSEPLVLTVLSPDPEASCAPK